MANDQLIWVGRDGMFGDPVSAFEVEDISTRENFVLVLYDKAVLLYNTSRIIRNGVPTMMYKRDLIQDYRQQGNMLVPYNTPQDYLVPEEYDGLTRKHSFLVNPHDCTSAKEYYDRLYRSAVEPAGVFGTNIAFLAHVDPVTFASLEDEEEE